MKVKRWIPVCFIGAISGIVARYGIDTNNMWIVVAGLFMAFISGALMEYKYPLLKMIIPEEI